MKRSTPYCLKVFFASIATIAITITFAYGANVTVRWDANVPAPEGYRVFVREDGQNYNYDHPIWENSLTTCTLTGLVEGTTYYFVVRAFEGDLESVDSAEVSYTPAIIVPNQSPVAEAGQNQVVYENASVTLNGSGSSDTDGTLVTYQWVQTGGTEVTINNASLAQASFTAPVVANDGDTLTFRLTVTDDDGSSDVANTTVSVLKSASTDVDGDGIPDTLDRFPSDPNEWADNDSDGIGNNQDTDDDNDGMTDAWEVAYGLDPLTNDAALDTDGDGVTNLDEFQAGTNPTMSPSNTAPTAPAIDSVTQTGRVDLTPVLVCEAYFDIDNDDHYQSQWQISTESDFSTFVLDETSKTQLTAYTVGEMVLDVDTAYYWRVRFIDSRNGVSEWSQTATFTTIAADSSDDTNINGVPDAQEVAESVDLNNNGIDDSMEDNIKIVNTVEGQTVIGVETASDNITLVSIKSLPTDTIPDQSVKLGFGLVGFKLYLLDPEVTTATVTIYFSSRVPKDAQMYKYIADTGWEVYPNAVFAPNRKSVALTLEDGGAGDEDGVKNGVIVDPSGIAYTDDSTTSASASLTTTAGGGVSASSGGGTCFISSGIRDLSGWDGVASNATAAMGLILTAMGGIFATVLMITRNK